jgi:hypothetical protein
LKGETYCQGELEDVGVGDGGLTDYDRGCEDRNGEERWKEELHGCG